MQRKQKKQQQQQQEQEEKSKPAAQQKSAKVASSAGKKSAQVANTADTREELDFMFDEEIPSTATEVCDSDSEYSDDEADYDEYEYDDLDDQTISKLVIITQTPPSVATNMATRKHGGLDRTGDFLPRSKITSDLARAINDGLYYYEQDLKKKTTAHSSAFEKTVDIVSNEQFSKLKNLEQSRVIARNRILFKRCIRIRIRTESNVTNSFRPVFIQ